MRLENDKTKTFLTYYVVIVAIIILVSLVMITGLSWQTNFNFKTS